MEDIKVEELRVLKALLSDHKAASDFANNQRIEFFSKEWVEIVRCLVDHILTYKSIPTQRIIFEKLPSSKEKLETLFEELSKIKYEPSEYTYDLQKIKDKYITNKIKSLNSQLDSPSPIAIKNIENIYKDIQKLNSKSKTAYIQKELKDYLSEFKKDYTARIKNPNLGQGVLTGYSYLDYITNGIRLGELLIIGGESSAGKSVLLNNMAIQMWMQKNTLATPTSEFTQGYNVLYFSLEMPYEACFRRTMARLADVSIYGLRDSKLSKAATDAVSLAGKFISRYPYRFEIVDIPRGLTVEGLEEIYLDAMSKYNPDVVCIDYLGLMEPGLEGDDWLKLGHLAGKIHEFGRAHKTRILTAVQLNRLPMGKTKPEEVVGLHRFGRSSLIAHHANICLQIESRSDEYLRSDFAGHLIKNRDGAKGSFLLSKRFSHASILDIPFSASSDGEDNELTSFSETSEDISEQLEKILENQ